MGYAPKTEFKLALGAGSYNLQCYVVIGSHGIDFVGISLGECRVLLQKFLGYHNI